MPKKVYLVMKSEPSCLDSRTRFSPDFCILTLTTESVAMIESRCAFTRAVQGSIHDYNNGHYNIPADFIWWATDAEGRLAKLFSDNSALDSMLCTENQLPELENSDNMYFNIFMAAADWWFSFGCDDTLGNNNGTAEFNIAILNEANKIIMEVDL